MSSKFQFVSDVGQGGMSDVRLAMTQSGTGGFQKLVVVKLLRQDLTDSAEYRKMFIDEARLTSRLNHHNVVQTYEVGEIENRPYISMEYLTGQTLSRVMHNDQRNLLTLSMRLRVICDVLNGLQYAHTLTDYDGTPLNVVHRDVTPSNVFITYDGHVKLIDFGIAKASNAVSHTRVGVMKGKTRYMAPEQILSTAIDNRVDIYSVGVIMWEMLANYQIWRGVTEHDVLIRMSRGEVPPPPPGAPKELHDICARAMAPDPTRRYANAEDMRTDIEDYLSIHATPSREHGVGNVVSHMFGKERDSVKQLIARHTRSTTTLAAIPSLVRSSSSASMRPIPQIPQFHPEADDDDAFSDESPHGISVVFAPPRPSQMAIHASIPQPMVKQKMSDSKKFWFGALIILSVLLCASLVIVMNIRPGAIVVSKSVASASVTPVISQSVNNVSDSPELPSVRGVTDTTITLGMSGAFSGPLRDLGNRMKLGLDTAISSINDNGGIAGRKLKLIALDDHYDGAAALSNTKRLIDDLHAFAIVGSVGTPPAVEVLPWITLKRVIYFGALSGASVLREDPPNRYVLNYRASYGEETAKMIRYLVEVRKIPDRSIVVFAQNNSYGAAGYDGAVQMMRKIGHNDDIFKVSYDANGDVSEAVSKMAEYDLEKNRHHVKAIIMIGTYGPCAKFIQQMRSLRINALFLNVSFVGSGSLAEELGDQGAGVVVTQVVPNIDSGATGVIAYRDALHKYHPDQQPDFLSLEGYVVGTLFAEGLRVAGKELNTEHLIDVFEQMRGFDPGVGGPMGFSISQHQASHKVWGTMLDAHGVFETFNME